jgi:hypothetical protein
MTYLHQKQLYNLLNYTMNKIKEINLKYKFYTYNTKMNEEELNIRFRHFFLDNIQLKQTNKGRYYSVTNEQVNRMQFFYVLKNNVSRKIASTIIIKNSLYEKTLNRRFNQLIKNNIIHNAYNEI